MNTTCGPVILLVDESSAMAARILDEDPIGGQAAKTRIQAVSTAINSLLRQLGSEPDVRIAVVGYRTRPDGEPDIGCRWAGALTGRTLVSSSELAANPLLVEDRTRRIPDPSSMTGFREEKIRFPVWHAAEPSGIAPQVKALQYCRELLAGAGLGEAQGLVIHLFSSSSSDGNPGKAIHDLRDPPSGLGALVFQAHLCNARTVPCLGWPQNRLYVPAGAMRDLFDLCSPLTPAMIDSLKAAMIPMGPGSRGYLYQARMADVSRLLQLVKVYAAQPTGTAAAAPKGAAPPPPKMGTPAPPLVPSPAGATTPLQAQPVAPAPGGQPLPASSDLLGRSISAALPDGIVEAATATAGVTEEQASPVTERGLGLGDERAALVLLVVDRSEADPFSEGTHGSVRLVEHANQILSQLARKATACIEAGVISYGIDMAGMEDVRGTFDGPLAGRELVKDSELADGALRTDMVDEQRSDGVGGLLTVTIKKPTWVELIPSSPASPVQAFGRAAQMIRSWLSSHPAPRVPPVVVHLTRGLHEPKALQDAVDQLTASGTPAPHLYHVVVSETPHGSVLWPETSDQITAPEYQRLFDITQRLFGAEALAASKPRQFGINSRGIVINAKPDGLLDGVFGQLERVS